MGDFGIFEVMVVGVVVDGIVGVVYCVVVGVVC